MYKNYTYPDTTPFWALDRFTREGLQKTIYYLQQLDNFGVNFHSFTEPYLNTDQEFVRDILISVLASLAKQERRRISERTKAITTPITAFSLLGCLL